MHYVVACTEEEYTAYCYSQDFKKGQEAIFVSFEALKGRNFDKVSDEFVLVGTWRQREGIGELMEAIEAFQELGKMPPRPRGRMRTPW